ncbi:hypothetical protein BS47DRAFT_1367588 [Hydnum rufescens UP504]|uniref:Uncharacterized protein n=1 Tax=Hydnum rufescens UP504 TaxID=1448309 RepID=A0A9P6AIV4_9AGAM|nr:hypothetical protein BS47DRAFT_1367588 [Hydnum rufescens UP504]
MDARTNTDTWMIGNLGMSLAMETPPLTTFMMAPCLLAMILMLTRRGHLLNLYFFLMEAQTHSVKILPDPMMVSSSPLIRTPPSTKKPINSQFCMKPTLVENLIVINGTQFYLNAFPISASKCLVLSGKHVLIPQEPHTISEVNFLRKLVHTALLAEDEDDLNNTDSSDLEFKMLESEDMDDDVNVGDEAGDAEHWKKIQLECTQRAKKKNIECAEGRSIDVPDMEAKLINLQAQVIGVNNQLHNNAISNDNALNNGPLSLDQKNVCQSLWGQYMRAVNFLAKEWGIKPYRILAEEPLKDWNGRMKREYVKLFEGLNDDEIATKKEALCVGLHEKRGTHDFEQAEEGQCGAIMVRNANVIKKQWYKQPDNTEEIQAKKHEASANRDTANATLASFMKPVLKPHGIGTKKTKTGVGWAFPGKQLGLKLCAKKITLVGWPDELPVLLPNGSKFENGTLWARVLTTSPTTH